jgi:hypothetical protein
MGSSNCGLERPMQFKNTLIKRLVFHADYNGPLGQDTRRSAVVGRTPSYSALHEYFL